MWWATLGAGRRLKSYARVRSSQSTNGSFCRIMRGPCHRWKWFSSRRGHGADGAKWRARRRPAFKTNAHLARFSQQAVSATVPLVTRRGQCKASPSALSPNSKHSSIESDCVREFDLGESEGVEGADPSCGRSSYIVRPLHDESDRAKRRSSNSEGCDEQVVTDET